MESGPDFERKDSPKVSIIELLENELKFWDAQIDAIKADIEKNENERDQLGRFKYQDKKKSLDEQLKDFTKRKRITKEKVARLKREGKEKK